MRLLPARFQQLLGLLCTERFEYFLFVLIILLRDAVCYLARTCRLVQLRFLNETLDLLLQPRPLLDGGIQTGSLQFQRHNLGLMLVISCVMGYNLALGGHKLRLPSMASCGECRHFDNTRFTCRCQLNLQG